VPSITLKKRLNRIFLVYLKGEMFNAFLKVNMTNPMPLVAVAAVVCELH
jgi:hypothetical protein